MRYILALFCLIPCFTEVKAQDQAMIRRDSLKARLAFDSAYIFRTTMAKPYLRVENRNSFITSERVNLLGFMAGATFFEKHTFCLGYYFLGIDPRTIRRLSLRLRSKDFLDLHYFNFSYVHVLVNQRYLQINVPLEAGFGRYTLELKDSTDHPIGKTIGNFVPFNAGVQFIFKPIKWAGFSITGGYRYVQQRELELSLKGWYYSLGVWIDARHLYRTGKYYLRKRKYQKEINRL
jgi:hypothetical protein